MPLMASLAIKFDLFDALFASLPSIVSDSATVPPAQDVLDEKIGPPTDAVEVQIQKATICC